jgi:hypothetical protein
VTLTANTNVEWYAEVTAGIWSPSLTPTSTPSTYVAGDEINFTLPERTATSTGAASSWRKPSDPVTTNAGRVWITPFYDGKPTYDPPGEMGFYQHAHTIEATGSAPSTPVGGPPSNVPLYFRSTASEFNLLLEYDADNDGTPETSATKKITNTNIGNSFEAPVPVDGGGDAPRTVTVRHKETNELLYTFTQGAYPPFILKWGTVTNNSSLFISQLSQMQNGAATFLKD